MKRWIAASAGLLLVAGALGYLAVDALRVEAPAALPSVSATPEPSASDVTPGVEAQPPATSDDAPSDAPEVTVNPGPQALPARLEIPSIGVDTSLEQLGLLDDGTLATPQDTDLAGWFKGGPRPGEIGPSVIAGHVSWNGDPSVFFRLTELSEGDEITVDQKDGGTAVFEVNRIEQHPKDAFPTVSVYANTEAPELRLITCGGEFDSSTGHFDDNIVVFASLVDA